MKETAIKLSRDIRYPLCRHDNEENICGQPTGQLRHAMNCDSRDSRLREVDMTGRMFKAFG